MHKTAKISIAGHRGLVGSAIQAVRAQGISVHRVILYGSQASGKQRPESDIDVAIVSEPIALSKRSYEKDTWIPIVHEIRKHGVALNI